MKAIRKNRPVVRDPAAGQPGHRLTPAATFGLLALVVIAVSACGSDTTAAAEGSPLAVMERFEDRVLAGDWSAAAEIYSADATWQIVTASDTSPVIPVFNGLPSEVEVADWDGDGRKTENDFLTSLGAEVYAGGLTALLSCEETDAETALCQETREGYAFQNPSHSANWTVTVADGLITSLVIDVRGNGVNLVKVIDFQEWVEDNYPDQAADLFIDRGLRNITPDNVDNQRELATEWLATQ